MISRIFSSKISFTTLAKFTKTGSVLTLARKYAPLHYQSIMSGTCMTYNFVTKVERQINRPQQDANIFEKLVNDMSEASSKYFNRISALKIIGELEELSQQSQISTENVELLYGEELEMFVKKLIQNLSIFDRSEELDRVLNFVLSILPREDNVLLDELVKSLAKYDVLKTFNNTNLNNLIYYLSIEMDGNNNDKTKDLLTNLKEKLITKINNGEISNNNIISHLDLYNQLASGKNFNNYGKKDNGFTKYMTDNAEKYLKDLTQYDTTELIKLHQFYYDINVESIQDTLTKIETMLIENITKLKNSDIVLLTYNLSHIRNDKAEFWSILEEEILTRIEMFGSNELTTIITSFARANQGSTDLYVEADRGIGLDVENLAIKDIPILVYLYSNSGRFRNKFFLLLEDIILENLQSYTIKQLGIILWSYSNVSLLNEILLKRIEQIIYNKISELDHEDIENIWDAYITEQIDPTKLFQLTRDKVLELLSNKEAINHNGFLKIVFQALGIHNQLLKSLGPGLKNALMTRFNNLTNNQEDEVFLIDVGTIVADNIQLFANQKDFVKSLKECAERIKANFVGDSETKMQFQYIITRADSLN